MTSGGVLFLHVVTGSNSQETPQPVNILKEAAERSGELGTSGCSAQADRHSAVKGRWPVLRWGPSPHPEKGDWTR